ncbi:MAG: actin-binding WH2 domain-containing protein [Pseudanabaena sp. M135S2SP2A07QC]|nr:actin-binding WH2 domain-containing protein [Pseudanabaena sp. M090S1SP2A07QC]MCA6506003.1 actin-binding WH2 domain-containing protein [Pseudanabaena sp. M172S2SP2A07QC]MCA6519149.1 actin-binding WH2 domain-containing protein [Pseudanabaena sp. M110S1SP2A07QC]MCA6522409.1 actin-binding WH2 domain-containing protein [Pseudanabaena sp. M051S1SP2A07QC]MCA6525491.1 actin-binding WH2 domain-containing protein [Pseudanabaena sp. M179S2SP2A07QC]MCA6529941.1 actin-binding WH2 domain-containing prot
MPFFSVLIDLLSDRDQFIQEIYDGIKVNTKIFGLLVCSSIFLAIYGGLIGAVSSWMQVLSSAAKLPFLFLITLAICLPALYFFNVYFGAKTRLSQYTAILLCAVTITSTLLFGFAPVTLFFLITTDSYSFFLLLNVAIFTLTGIIGVYFLYQVLLPKVETIVSDKSLVIEDTAIDKNRKVRISILKFWLGLYAFVGSQMAWTLRPFFASFGSKFDLFRPREGNFYMAVWNAIKHLFVS